MTTPAFADAPDSPETRSLAKVRNRDLNRRRQHSLRIAARSLSSWLNPDLPASPGALEVAADRWLARLGDDNVRKLTMRLRRMADWELLRAEQMRDAGASE